MGKFGAKVAGASNPFASVQFSATPPRPSSSAGHFAVAGARNPARKSGRLLAHASASRAKGAPHALGRERQFAEPQPREPREGVGDGGTDGDQAAFPRTLGAEGPAAAERRGGAPGRHDATADQLAAAHPEAEREHLRIREALVAGHHSAVL